MKHDRFTGTKIGRRHTQRNPQFLKCSDLQNSFEKWDHAVVRSEAAARKSPSRQRSETRIARDLLQFSDRQATAIRSANQRSYAGPGDDSYWNAFFFQNLQNTNMSDAAGKSAAESESYGRRARRRQQNRFARELPPEGFHRPDNSPQTIHDEPHVLSPRADSLNPIHPLCKMPYLA